MKTIYLTLLLAIGVMGCQKAKENTMMVGGACSYKAYMNKIKIISIEENNATEACQKSVNLSYEILKPAEDLPVSPRKTLHYQVSKEYMIKKGFDIGTEHMLKISTITSGTCTPIMEKIMGLDVMTFKKKCQEKDSEK